MHVTFFCIDADVRLQSEVPLLALAGLTHRRIALFLLVLGRRRRMNNGRIDDRAGLDADALSRQMQVHRVEHGTAEVMLFEQVTEAQHGRFIRCRSHAQVNASEPSQRGGLVKRLFDAGVGQVEPLLHEVGPQHDRKPDRTTAVADLRVVWLDQSL
jgi:hypothetical protein